MEGEVMQDAVQPAQKNSKWGLHTIVNALFFLIPIFAVPVAVIPFQYSKVSITIVATVVALLVVLYVIFKKTEIRSWWSLLLISLWGVPITYFVSAIFSQSPSLSFFGYQLETGTFGFILLGATVATLTASLFSEGKYIGALKAFGFGACIVFIFQLVQVLFGAPLPITFFNDPTANLIGRWSDFGIFAGLAGILSLLAFNTFKSKWWMKVICVAIFISSIFFLALVNIIELWILFAVASFIILVLLIFRLNRGLGGGLGAVVLAGAGVLSALVFIFAGSLASGAQETFAIRALDVRPSIQGTTNVLQQVYATNPVLGTGPNTFSSNWFLYRPEGVLTTPFWDTSFNTGSGMIPTAFATGGLLVLAAWVIFTLLLLYTLVRAIFTVPTSRKTYFATVFSALSVLYLLVAHYIFAPNQTLTLLFFLFLGLFMGSIKDTMLVRKVSVPLNTSLMRQAYVVVAVIFAVISVYVVFDTARTYASSVYHEQAVQVANQGDFDKAQQSIKKAISFKKQDRYLRTSTLINLGKMRNITQSGQEVTDDIRNNFQAELAQAIEASNEAIEINNHSYQNWIIRALVYTNVVPLGVDGAFDLAVNTLEEARSRNPKSPEVDFRLADINLAVGNVEEAKTLLRDAISKKPNYTDAILLLARVEYSSGNLREAIESVRALVFFEPRNPTLLYQLGILLLQDKNYEESALAFEAALGEQGDFANAAFFLAQSYAFLDKFDEATQLMVQLAQRNPDNELVAGFAQELGQGINPFGSEEVVSPEEEEIVQ